MNPPEYPEDTDVEVRYPLTKEQETGPRDQWPWLKATVTEVCGPDEWQVCIADDRAAACRDGDLWYPLAFRDHTEIRTPEAGTEAQAG